MSRKSVYSCPVLQAGPSVPKGLATLPDGSVDADYYTVNQGMHGDFVAGLKAIMAGTFPWLCVQRQFCVLGQFPGSTYAYNFA